MRRTVFHLVLWPVLAGLATGAPAATRRHARAAAETARPAGKSDAKAAKEAQRDDPCADLSRSRRRACEAREAKAADAEAARDGKRAAAEATQDPCAKLARRRKAACEREVAAAIQAEVRRTERAPKRAAAAAAKAEEPRTARAASGRREVQPSDLVGGVETDAPVASARASPALRGALAPDIAAPFAGAAPRAGSRNGRRPARLHEVVLEDGQSLADLAASSGISVADLAKLNGVTSVEDVPTGMRLKVPGAASTPAVAAALPPPRAPEPLATASVAPAPATAASQPSAQQASTPMRTARTERRAIAAAPSSGPRPYASLGPVGSSPAPSAPVGGRWGRTQADALAAYAVASARAPHLADREDARHERFVWPVRAEVVSAFGPHGEGRRNDGLDLAARPGDAVRASAAGEVVYAGKEIAGTGGNLVLLKHADGWVTAYSHLGRVVVAMRQTVDQGQEIAESPDVAGASVHFEVRQPGAGGAKPVDPVSVLPARGGGETGRG